MTINVEKNNDDLKFILKGRLDSTTADELDAAMSKELENATGNVTVDLSDVDFISSKGLRVLVGAYKKLSNKELILKGANESIKEVIRLSGLLKIFKME